MSDLSQATFRFVQQLAGELSTGELELPYLPDIAIKIQKLLKDPECEIDRVAKAVSTEPGLAARLLRLANSVQYSAAGHEITEAPAAVNRLGMKAVSNVAWQYALSQMQHQPELQPVAAELRAEWQASTHVAALAFVIAKECGMEHQDESLMAGMVHNVGKVYIISRIATREELQVSLEDLGNAVRDWHPAIGKAIVESWEFADEIVAAVEGHIELDRTRVGYPDATDVLTLAVCKHDGQPEDLTSLPGARRLGFDTAIAGRLDSEAQDELDALRASLSG